MSVKNDPMSSRAKSRNRCKLKGQIAGIESLASRLRPLRCSFAQLRFAQNDRATSGEFAQGTPRYRGLQELAPA